MTGLAVLLAAASLTSAPAPDAPPARRFAIVVGNNLPWQEPTYEPLVYADDDAIRFARFFERAGAEVHLLTVPDEETARRFPDTAARALPPTRRNLEAALAKVDSALDATPELPTDVFFYFSGHGSMDAANARLHLLDGGFSRTDLHRDVLARLAPRRLHVIIDSCYSYFLVNPRGARIPVAEDEYDLDRYPTAGFLLSTSERKEVHEWVGYRGGVFSHQVLGALMGAADVDRDGVIHYNEVHAYLAAANRDVTDEAARINPYVRYPVASARALVDLRGDPPGRCVEVPAGVGGAWYVTDRSGDRVLDAHTAPGAALRLSLPPGEELLLRRGEDLFEATCTPGAPAPFVARAESAAPSDTRTRGTVADQFRDRLFLRPLTLDFAAGFDAGTQSRTVTVVATPPPPPRWYRDPLVLALLGGAGAGVVAGGTAAAFYADAKADANRRPITSQTWPARQRAERAGIAMSVGFAAAGALLTAAALHIAFGADGE